MPVRVPVMVSVDCNHRLPAVPESVYAVLELCIDLCLAVVVRVEQVAAVDKVINIAPSEQPLDDCRRILFVYRPMAVCDKADCGTPTGRGIHDVVLNRADARLDFAHPVVRQFLNDVFKIEFEDGIIECTSLIDIQRLEPYLTRFQVNVLRDGRLNVVIRARCRVRLPQESRDDVLSAKVIVGRIRHSATGYGSFDKLINKFIELINSNDKN